MAAERLTMLATLRSVSAAALIRPPFPIERNTGPSLISALASHAHGTDRGRVGGNGTISAISGGGSGTLAGCFGKMATRSDKIAGRSSALAGMAG
jgi:hypothetical protein